MNESTIRWCVCVCVCVCVGGWVTHLECVGQVVLVAQHKHRDPCQLVLLQQRMELGLGRVHLVGCRCVHHVDNGVDTTAVPEWHDDEREWGTQ
jgi:hypothetical protein